MRALIFDLDGTLVDTVYAHIFSWQLAFAEVEPCRPAARARADPPGDFGPALAFGSAMIEQVVEYLHSRGASFRLSSLPSPETLPEVAYRLPAGGVMLQTHVLIVGGVPTIACTARGAQLSLPRLVRELGAPVVFGNADDLPPPARGAEGPLPALGGALGAPTILDEQLAVASSVSFEAFTTYDILEMPYDDFARIERPRVASFAIGGELPEGLPSEEPERKTA